MGFLDSLNISGSGLTAQRLRLDIIAENLTNIDTTRTEAGGPYRRKLVVFQSNEPSGFRFALGSAFMRRRSTPGVHVEEIAEDGSEFKMNYDPSHPDADENGYVALPNVDMIKETTDSMAASRAYEANVTAFNAVKLMAQKALEVGR